MESKNKLIYKGYNGIMDLDLTNIDTKFHKILITDHLNDIEKYKKEQSLLDPELRYENNIFKSLRKMEAENLIRSKRLKINK